MNIRFSSMFQTQYVSHRIIVHHDSHFLFKIWQFVKVYISISISGEKKIARDFHISQIKPWVIDLSLNLDQR